MNLSQLAEKLSGEVYDSKMWRQLYATDASVYRELPQAVAFPKNDEDIRELIGFARDNDTSLIPRTAGTSLAGQCVGDGIVVDVSRYMNRILEINEDERWARVEPGVIRDELNFYLKPKGLLFGPNTSTSNRAMIGGMVGNNSCGSYSIVYGSTRDHVLELSCILSDGSHAVFGPLSPEQLKEKSKGDSLEASVYKQMVELLSRDENQAIIENGFPKKGVHRRNNGYSLDVLLDSQPFGNEKTPFNLCNLICGSEGTLAFITEIKVNLEPLPPRYKALVCAHFEDVIQSLRGTQVAMQHQLQACELMDKVILDCTKDSIEFARYRFFVEGEPGAIIVCELADEDQDQLQNRINKLSDALKNQGGAYACSIVEPPNIDKVWKLRAAGLGLLSNLPGDSKPVAVVEDTAVALEDLPQYIDDFREMMKSFGQEVVYYAHAGAGELHLRPILNLKKPEEVRQFREIGKASAELVKAYGGSLAGEHGLGRVRAEFVPTVMGDGVYKLFKSIKSTWDPENIFNPGKLVEAEPMDEKLRYKAPQKTADFDTAFNYDDVGGILRMAEKCNGSGDCRKLHILGGTMCPSYMATRKEKDSTRARANTLREVLTNSSKTNAFDDEDLKEVMDLCLSCKGCTGECPSGVDVASMKAEFLHQYYKTHGIPWRNKLFAQIGKMSAMATAAPWLHNFMASNKATSFLGKWMLGVAQERSLPLLHQTTLRKFYDKHWRGIKPAEPIGKVFFLADEFTNFNDTEIGIKALKLLAKLGYDVEIPKHAESGRTHISKGLLDDAAKLANQNINSLADKVSPETPLVGIEPSCILGFRDEYLRLAKPELKQKAKYLSDCSLLLDEFLQNEIKKGNLKRELFSKNQVKVLLHGHCHQKALSSVDCSKAILEFPENYSVEVIPSGCCGMAGSFGYEKEHYELSMQIGELVLFPTVRNAPQETIIAAPGTSCRHQVKDGTGRKASHPVEIMYDALI